MFGLELQIYFTSYFLVLLLSALLQISQAANILILHPLYAGSHDLVLRLVGDRLVARGHSVTQIRSDCSGYREFLFIY